jgi:penicillin-binding protein 1C
VVSRDRAAAPPPAGPAWAGARQILPPSPGRSSPDPDIRPGASVAGKRRRAAWRSAGGWTARTSARPGRLWAPVPGRHTLALVDLDGRVVDAVLFEVRGQASAHAD